MIDSGFRIKPVKQDRTLHINGYFSSCNVVVSEDVAGWLGTRYTWVLARARKAAPASQRQLFMVTNEGMTRQVEVVDRGYEIAIALVA